MIPDKITWAKAQTTREQTEGKAKTFPVTSLDFTAKGHQWNDWPNLQLLRVTSPMVKTPHLTIMGGQSATAYNADWTEQQARQALLDQLGLTVPPVDPVPAAKTGA